DLWLRRLNRGGCDVVLCVRARHPIADEVAALLLDVDDRFTEAGFGEGSADRLQRGGPGDAPRQRSQLILELGRRFAHGDHVGDGQSSTWFQNAKRFTKYGAL